MHVVFGGAFNPPTKAHLDVFYFLDHQTHIHTFTYLPVGKTYGKEALASDEHRYAMLTRMLSHLSKVEVSRLEFEDSEYKGTYHSLKRLQKGDEAMAFVIGADHLDTLHQWKHADALLDTYDCLILNRHDTSLKHTIDRDPFLKKHEESLKVFPNFKVNISSSDFRRTHDADLLVPAVYEYIREHGLYGFKKKG